jgi:hypothetical protein
MESKVEHNQPSKEEVVTLKDFIDEHQKVLAVIGVFVALSVFWSNLPLKHISSFISFLCLAATVPLFLEIYRRFDYRKSSWLLIIFLNIFTPLMGYTAWYLLIGYRSHWRTQMGNLVFWTFAIPMWMLYKGLLYERAHAWAFDWLILRYRRRFRKEYEETAAESREKLERNLNDPKYTEEDKQKYRNDFEKLVRETLASDLYSDKESPLDAGRRKNIRLLINVMAILIIVVSCSFISNSLASAINVRLDKIYESYNAVEATPTPSPVVMPSPSITPTPVMSPEATPTPIPSPSVEVAPSPLKSKRRRGTTNR